MRLIFTLLALLVCWSAHAQIAGNVRLETKGPGKAGNYTAIVFNGEAQLPGINQYVFVKDASTPDGGCEFHQELASLSLYAANTWHQKFAKGQPFNECGERSWEFRWIPRPMYTPKINLANTSLCAQKTFVLSLDMQPGDRIDQYHWEQSPDNGVTWNPIAGVANANTAEPQIQVTALTVTTQQQLLYRVSGYRNQVLVAPASAALPVFIFPAPLDQLTGTAYEQNQSTTWQMANHIPIALGKTIVGQITANHLTCASGNNASIRIRFNAPHNPTDKYYYSLAKGNFKDSLPREPMFAGYPVWADNIAHPSVDTAFGGLGKGEYTLAIENKDANGTRLCYEKYLIRIKSPEKVTLQGISETSPTCTDGNQGQISLKTEGGAAATTGSGHSYSIVMFKNGVATQTLSGLAAGNHQFSGLTQGNYYFKVLETGCGADTLARYPATGNIALHDPANMSATAVADAAIVCEGGNGAIKLNFTTGNPHGNYAIEAYRNGKLHTKASHVKFSSGNYVFANLPAGSYTFRLAHSCGNDSFEINTPTELKDLPPVTVALAPLKATGNQYAVSCNGANDGRLALRIVTGTATYSLVLKQAGAVVPNPSFTGFGTTSLGRLSQGDSLVFTGLAAATYSLEISQNGCPVSAKTAGTVALTAPPAITAQINPVLKPGNYHVTCANGEDGQIEVSNIAGSHGNYAVEIFENGNKINPATDTTNHKVTFGGLRPDAGYNIQISDSKGCSYTSPTSIRLVAPAALAARLAPQRVSCKGAGSGRVIAQISGGIKPYTIQWINATGAPVGSETKLAANTDSVALDNLPAGNYTLRVRDAWGCYNFAAGNWFETSTTVHEPVAALAFVPSAFVVRPVSCPGGDKDGQVTLALSGGWDGYLYSKDGVNYQASPVFGGFGAGRHTFYAKDAEDCIVSTQVDIEEPAPLVLAPQQLSPVSCKNGYDGVFTFEAKGGNSEQPYALLVNGAAYPEADWSNWAINRQITLRGLAAGHHTVRATDYKGCTQVLAFSITEPELLTTSIYNITNATCGQANGRAEIKASGGTTPYAYAWNKYDETLGTLKTWSTVATLANAQEGSYEVIVTDARGCSVSKVVQISNTEAAKVQVSNLRPVSCAENKDGEAVFSVSGDFPVTVAWATTSETGQIRWQNNHTLVLSNLSKGTHYFQTRDHKGCVRFEQVLVPGPAPLLIGQDQSTNPTCHNGNDGTLKINLSGGTPPYRIGWGNGLAANVTSFDQMTAGTYTVVVTDQAGCTRQASFILQNPPPLDIKLGTGNSTICAGQSVTLKPELPAGTTYSWTSASGTFNSQAQEVTLTIADTYLLTATTPAGCVGKGQYQLETSVNAFKADFMMASEAFVGDTVAAIEICYPMPDKVHWDIEGLDNTVASLAPSVAAPDQQLIFNTPGTYRVRLYAWAGKCQDTYEQQIVVKKAQDKRAGTPQPTSGGNLPVQHIEAKISPNPVSNGRCSLEVNLAYEAPVRVDMVRLASGNRWRLKQPLTGNNDTHYKWQIALPEMVPGVYALRVQTSGKQRIIKLIIN